MTIKADNFKVYLNKAKNITKIEAYDVETDEWVDVTNELWAIKMAERLIMKELK